MVDSIDLDFSPDDEQLLAEVVVFGIVLYNNTCGAGDHYSVEKIYVVPSQ